jgi:UDP-N-acetyl-D-galactosamine dehydrogenase
VKELMQYSINVHIIDPHASPNEVAHEYNLTLVDAPSGNYDAVVVAVAHDEYKALAASYFSGITTSDALLMDLKGLYEGKTEGLEYWRL